MRLRTAIPLALAAGLLVAPARPARAAGAEVGKPAPAFSLKDTEGKEHKLADYAGKIVVLEWFNPDCPFVKYAHGKGDLKDQGNELQSKGIVVLAINSGAPGKQGHGLERNAAARKEYAMSYPVLLDESGTVGKAYDARTTPHIFVIDSKGVLVYKGAIDNAPFGEIRTGSEKVNYLARALAAVAAGTSPDPAETGSYGCSVKYAQ